MKTVRECLYGDDRDEYDRLSDDERAAFDAEFKKSWQWQAGQFAAARDEFITALGVHRFLSWLDRQLLRITRRG